MKKNSQNFLMITIAILWKIITEIVGSFENDSSIIKINNNDNENANHFQFQKIDENTISKLFNDLSTKVSTGEDKIPAKLTKLAKKHLIKPLTDAINISIASNIFPSKAKRGAVTPLDKGG